MDSQENIAMERKQLERSKALFEQRKIAAREEIENADEITAVIREAESRTKNEMERLVQLSEYVMQKD